MSYYVIIRGPLGSGKTTIAKCLAEKLAAQYFSIDQVLDDNHLAEEKEDGYISQKSFITTNEIIAPEIKKSLIENLPVIIDGNFYWKSQIDDLISRLDYPHFAFTLKAPLELCIERDSQREHPHGGDAAGAVYEKVIEFSYGIEIDATQSIDGIVDEILKTIKLIKIFESIRDIPYRIPLSAEEEDRCCSGKAKKLKELLGQGGLQVRYRVCEFKWSDFEKIPSFVSNIPHSDDSTHVYLEVLIDGTWVIVDPTWDKGLASYFEIADWNGRTDTPTAVEPLSVYDVEKSRNIMEEESKEAIEKDLDINGKFYAAFNEWLDSIRHDDNKSRV